MIGLLTLTGGDRSAKGGTGLWHRTVCSGLLVLFLAACAQTKAHISTGIDVRAGKGTQILLMPIDVELSELTASGLLEPQAAWTEAGRKNVSQALVSMFSEKGQAVLHFEEEDDDVEPRQLQVLKLHQAVGKSILVHKYIPALELPTKKNRFDWSLGPQTVALRETYGADYALFVYMRDSFSSDGRVALSIVAAMLGVALQGGQQVGFASLVDLKSGDVVWFNTMQSQYGDLRDPASARGACEDLLDKLPI